MQSLVVFFAFAAVACGSLVPLAQPAHHPAWLLDPHGRPLDTAEVINARAIHLQAKALEPHHAPVLAHAAVAPIAHAAVAPIVHTVAAPAVIAAPAAVSHQSRVDVRTSPAVITSHVAPVISAHSTYAAPLLTHSAHGLAGHGHLLKKRSLGHLAYSAPIIAHAAPAAVSHQSRVDVVSSPAVVSHAVTAPVLAHAAIAPVVAHVAPAAVSHQSRVDVHTSPAIVTAHATPFLSAHSTYAAPLLGHSALGFAGHGHGHFLKKRSVGHLAYSAHVAPAAIVTHAVAAPVIAHAAIVPVAHAIAPSAVSHQSRVDVHTSPAIVSHSVVAAPIVSTHTGYGLFGHGHLLKKRSLAHITAPIAFAHAPAAVSHQSRHDVISRPAIITETVSAPVITHAAPIVPLAHSAIWTAPASHLLHAAPLAHATHW